MSTHALQKSCAAMCVFCSTLLSVAFTNRLGINPMDLGLMCLSLYGQGRRQTLRRRKMMTGFVANGVATVLVIYRANMNTFKTGIYCGKKTQVIFSKIFVFSTK